MWNVGGGMRICRKMVEGFSWTKAVTNTLCMKMNVTEKWPWFNRWMNTLIVAIAHFASGFLHWPISPRQIFCLIAHVYIVIKLIVVPKWARVIMRICHIRWIVILWCITTIKNAPGKCQVLVSISKDKWIKSFTFI